MSNEEMTAFILEQKEELENSVKRKLSLQMELENDKATLAYLQDLMDNGESLPPGNPYGSFADWCDTIQKQIKTTENSLKNISTDETVIAVYEIVLEKLKDGQDPVIPERPQEEN